MSKEDEVKKAIVARIQEVADDRGISGAELSRRSGLDRHAVYRVLNGRSLTFDQVWAIADGLGMSPVDLLPVEQAESSAAQGERERRLLEAVRNSDAEAIRAELADLLPADVLAKVLDSGEALASERAEFIGAIAQATEGLSRLARLARLADPPES